MQSGNLAGAQQAFASLEQSFSRQSQSANQATSTGPAVVVNLGGSPGAAGATGDPATTSAPASSSASTSSAGPEIIINLGANAGPEQLTIDVNNTGNSGAEQLSISLGTQQNPTSQGELTLNISPNSNEQIVLNLLNGQASSPSPISNGLSVVA